MKIDKITKTTKKPLPVQAPKNKKEVDKINEKLKMSSKTTGETKSAFGRTILSSEQKTPSKQTTPVKTAEKHVRDSEKQYRTSSPKTAQKSYKDSKKPSSKTESGPKKVPLEKSVKMQEKIKIQKVASPTKLRRATPTEEIRKISITKEPSQKPSDSEKTVQFSERIRSQSVIPTTNHEKKIYNRSVTPNSLPGSPIRVQSANGGTKILTSEVFTRTHDYNGSGSIEVIYKQPYENLRKIRTETETSLIDTTDSSLSESVALPSSPSDHEISSDPSMRLKSLSPRRSLESIHEAKHRVSDLNICSEIPERDQDIRVASLTSEEDTCVSLLEKVLLPEEETKGEDRISPILDVETVVPPRMRHKFDYVEEMQSSSKGNTLSVLPEAKKAVFFHSMPFRIETPDEVQAHCLKSILE